VIDKADIIIDIVGSILYSSDISIKINRLIIFMKSSIFILIILCASYILFRFLLIYSAHLLNLYIYHEFMSILNLSTNLLHLFYLLLVLYLFLLYFFLLSI